MAQAGGKTSDPAERLLDAAARLFCCNGIHATGIDKILAESGAAKMTLYKHFRSKEGLVQAVLEREGAAWRDWFLGSLDKMGGSPKDRLLGVFDVLGSWFGHERYYGCVFINAVAEHDKNDDSIRRLTLDHKRQVLHYLRNLAQAAGAPDPDGLSHQLGLLMDGAIVAAMVLRSAEPAKTAKLAAAAVIDSALAASSSAAA